jgi:FkbM family methyltransferase
MKIPHRFFVVRPWLLARAHGETPVSARAMLQFLAQPGRDARARKWIERIEEEDEYTVITFHDVAHPLFWPSSEDKWSLWMLINEQFYQNDWHQYETPETPVEPEDVVVDCGACEGLFSLRIADRCTEVHAVEPYPQFVQTLERTLGPFANATIHEVALSDVAGPLHLSLTQLGQSEKMVVQAQTLDHLFLQHDPPVSYLKADVEGHELPLLQGAAGLIRQNRPKIAVTVYHEANDYLEIMRFIRDIDPSYQFRIKGITASGKPVMLHAW